MILCEDNLWESDYILNELLPKQEVKFIPFDYIERVNFTCDIFIFVSRKHNFWNIKETVKRIEPKIIIMLSDEFYQENLFEYNMLGNYCDLFLRNYHHQYYNYTSNTLVFPLGYTNGCKKFTSNKKYNWSFVGKITKDWCSSDREEMVNIFSQLPNHYINTNLSQEEMCKIYSQSHFVPCGRGNSSLDCFRLYEASMNGAIPVVVGSQKEIEYTFKYEENPPWVFANTWEDAFEKCKHMLECGVDNKPVLDWWNNRIQKIKNKVLEVL